jgi:hypothetical protein
MSGGEEPVGTLGEEALKLMQALQEWGRGADTTSTGGSAGTAGPEGAAGTDGIDGEGNAGTVKAAAAARAAAAMRRVNEHVATGGEDCRYCPVCQAIAAVRSTSPEVRQHLSSAASSLMQAAAGLLATTVPEDAGRRSAPVERIDLGEGSGEWEDE